jgi:hypothetical protein
VCVHVQYVYDDYWTYYMYNVFMTITGLISYYLSVTHMYNGCIGSTKTCTCMFFQPAQGEFRQI